MPHTPASNALSLRSQVAWAFGLLVVVLAATLSVALAVMLTRQVEREEGHQLRIVAANVAQVLSDGVLDRSREIQVLADAESLWREGLASPSARGLLGRAQAIQPGNTWIGVVDTGGIVRAATGDLMVGRNVKERPWFAPSLKQTHVGDVHPAKLLAALLPATPTGDPLRFLDFASPVRVDGRTVGVLVAHGTWDWARVVVERLAPEHAAAKQLQSFIFDRHGKMIYAPVDSAEHRLGMVQALPLAAETAPGSPHATVVSWDDGVDYLTSAVRVDGAGPARELGWTVVSREPVRIAFADAHDLAVRALSMGVVCAALSSWLAWLLAGSITRPLAQIAKAAREVEQGTSGATIPQLESSTEVAQLVGALSTMTDKLVRSNAELEQRVQARTSELERANDELNKLARHDPLSGLLNRRGFQERLKAALSSAARRQSPVSVIVIDADHFKRVNDTHGHEAGDLTLCAIAEHLRSRLRESDVVARLGGEEFVALLPDTPIDGALQVAEDLVRAIAALSIPQVGHITVSAGVAPVAVGEDDGSLALRCADEALYRAKESGRNRAVCHAVSEHATL